MLAKLTLFFAMIVAIFCGNPRAWSDDVLRLDMRDGHATDHSYFVIFFARRSSTNGPGHSFVGWTELDGAGATVHSSACGFYPQRANLIGCLIPQKGQIVDELTREGSLDPAMWTQRLVVQVDRDAYHAAWKEKECWCNSNKNFHIIDHNCTHFTHDVAQAIGLQLPNPHAAEFPPDYMARLMRILCCQVRCNDLPPRCVDSVARSTMTSAAEAATCSESDSACSTRPHATAASHPANERPQPVVRECSTATGPR